MWATNLKILGVTIGTIALYTLVANVIPQIESEVPEELSFTGEVGAAELASAGEELYAGAGGCTACHGLGERAPNLLTGEGDQGPIGARCGARVEGEDCKTYLHRSMVEPGAFVVPGYQPIMPDVSRTLSANQIWALVAYLQSQGGEIDVTAADLETEAAGEEGPAGGSGAAVATATDPQELLDQMQCLACHRLGSQGQEVGPSFDGIGARRDAAYIRGSILDPAAEVTPGYERFAGLMPTNFGERLTAAQLEAIVDFLSNQR
ncbi:MAG TPA: c-type cytochrome [Gemmatimonadota bacterium]|nr:c-type cytochrome [Gemmatimonadota bacterium]